MPGNHLMLCRPLLLPPSIFPSVRGFSNASVLHQVARCIRCPMHQVARCIRWPWSCSFSISPPSEGCCQDGIWKFRSVGASRAPCRRSAGAHACSVASGSLRPPRRTAPSGRGACQSRILGPWGHFFFRESWTPQRESESGAGQPGCGALGRQRRRGCEPGAGPARPRGDDMMGQECLPGGSSEVVRPCPRGSRGVTVQHQTQVLAAAPPAAAGKEGALCI